MFLNSSSTLVDLAACIDMCSPCFGYIYHCCPLCQSALSTCLCCCCREKDKKKKKGDADAESGGDSPGSPGDDAENEPEEVVWMTDTSEQAAKDRAQAQLTKAMADMVTQASTLTLSVIFSDPPPTKLQTNTYFGRACNDTAAANDSVLLALLVHSFKKNYHTADKQRPAKAPFNKA